MKSNIPVRYSVKRNIAKIFHIGLNPRVCHQKVLIVEAEVNQTNLLIEQSSLLTIMSEIFVKTHLIC